MKTCIIGGAGFLGTHLTTTLLNCDRDIVILDRAKGFDSQRVRSVVGDYGDKETLENALQDVDEVVLLAYASVPKASFEDPSTDMLRNVPPALTFFEIASKFSLRKIVFVSSGGTVYGQSIMPQITETHPTNPISPYGITKLALEKYAGMYLSLYSLPVVIVRPANAYGEGQRPYSGQGLISTLIASFIDSRAITLYGDNDTVRDYIHASDIASAITAALDHGKPGECYNIGTAHGTSNLQVYTLVKNIAKHHGVSSPNITINSPRVFDVRSNVLNFGKLHTLNAWVPKITMEEGISKAWEWVSLQKRSLEL